jgi:ABC-type lipoprotein release transport system permease subunit
LLAVVGGSLLGGSILGWYEYHGIDLSGLAQAADYAGISRMLYPSVEAVDFLTGGWITLVITVLFSLYPAWRASRLLPVAALRQT